MSRRDGLSIDAEPSGLGTDDAGGDTSGSADEKVPDIPRLSADDVRAIDVEIANGIFGGDRGRSTLSVLGLASQRHAILAGRVPDDTVRRVRALLDQVRANEARRQEFKALKRANARYAAWLDRIRSLDATLARGSAAGAAAFIALVREEHNVAARGELSNSAKRYFLNDGVIDGREWSRLVECAEELGLGT